MNLNLKFEEENTKKKNNEIRNKKEEKASFDILLLTAFTILKSTQLNPVYKTTINRQPGRQATSQPAS